MITIDFEDAIAELLHQIYATSPRNESLATTPSRSSVDATNRPSLRLVPKLSEVHSLENASK